MPFQPMNQGCSTPCSPHGASKRERLVISDTGFLQAGCSCYFQCQRTEELKALKTTSEKHPPDHIHCWPVMEGVQLYTRDAIMT